uniref:Eukaryotic translation initiation factor 5A n=1 Tax=Amphora coffeiformis TaxID=265554 RepID=A0A7S3L130_9STRA|mmetsp:Transcript_16252/g.30943  ORF Transcript_16252/g.30943 Transcript_16252/m.30943 type:complete len:161 (+) Transcript_16252:109-591(+)
MADDDHDYAIESADAGASTTIPMEAGQIKKGGYMMIKGKPCKVLNISVSKTGKHGHAKCNFTATDIFTGKKYEDMIPSTHGTTVPIVNKTEWEIIDIDGDELTLMDEAGNQKTDLNLPSYPEGLADEIRDAWNGGENQISVSVQSAVNIEQIISYKKVTE